MAPTYPASVVGTATALVGVAEVVLMRERQRALGTFAGCAARRSLGSEALLGPVRSIGLEVQEGLV